MLFERAEDSFLVQCVRSFLHSTDVKIGSNLDWAALEAKAREHGVLPLVSRACARHLQVPESVRDSFRRAIEENVHGNLRMTRELIQATDALASDGIPSMAYKGPVLAAEAYGDLGLRQFLDLDLLIPKPLIARAKEGLLKRGYRPLLSLTADQERAYLKSQVEYGFRREGSAPIELHWNILPEYFNVPLGFSYFRPRSQNFVLGGATLRTFSPEDLLLVLCLHGGKHFWERLGWVADIAAVLRAYPHLDWTIVEERARSLRIERLVFVGLHVAHRLLEAPVPRAWLRHDETRRIGEQVCRQIFVGPLPGLKLAWFYGVVQRGFWRRLRYGLRLALSPTEREWECIRLPPSLFRLYSVFRPLRLVGRHAFGMIREPHAG